MDQTLYLCPGETVSLSSCGCGGDTYLRLFNATGSEVASNDDSCNYCSAITYAATGDCQTYKLKQGCYASGSCSGTVMITVTTGTSLLLSLSLLLRFVNYDFGQ